MKLSAKGRYALAALITMGQHFGTGEYITVNKISEGLGISKIYLEQVFSLLKKGNLVTSVKGAQGGYQLARNPEQITVLDALQAVEFSLFEKSDDTATQAAPEIEAALRSSVFDVVDHMLITVLSGISLADLMAKAEQHKEGQALMFFI